MKAGSHTGIAGIPESGHGDVGIDGADRRPFARAPGRERCRDRRISAAIMVEAARAVSEAGNPRSAPAPHRIPHVKLRAFEGIVPKSTDWTTLGARGRGARARSRRLRDDAGAD